MKKRKLRKYIKYILIAIAITLMSPYALAYTLDSIAIRHHEIAGGISYGK